MDYGKLTDHNGKTVDFRNVVLIMTTNAILLAVYSFGCHSLRHLTGGFKDVLSGSPLRKKTYDCVSCFNRHHPKWAWFSLVWVVATDLYIYLVASGAIPDLNTWSS